MVPRFQTTYRQQCHSYFQVFDMIWAVLLANYWTQAWDDSSGQKKVLNLSSVGLCNSNEVLKNSHKVCFVISSFVGPSPPVIMTQSVVF